MQRTNTTIWLIALVALAMAVAAAPAAARTEISSSDQAPPADLVFRVHPQGTVPDVSAPAVESSGYQSLNSITGAESASPTTTRLVEVSDGFQWDDAVVGALVALGLVSITLVTVRHHRPTASRA